MLASDNLRIRRLKNAYWNLRGGFIWDWFLQLIGMQIPQHWCRVVMDRETQVLVNDLKHEHFRTLEISGTKWKTLCTFAAYESVGYPAYDICESPLDKTFDFIIAEQVWEHLKWPYRASRNVHSMLAPGGYFLLTTPFLLKVHEVPIDCSRWTEDGLRYLLAECGFELEKIRTGSWGNRACLEANLKRWIPYRRWLHSLRNEATYPVVVWALAQKNLVS